MEEAVSLAGHDLGVAQGVGQERHALVGAYEGDREVVGGGQGQLAELVRHPVQEQADDPAGITEVAAAALREDGHAGQVHELTGPALTTPRQRAEAIGEAIGEPVLFVEQTREEARAQMLRFMPEPVVDTTLAIIGEPTPAERRVSPDVERVLGRAPRSYAEWARSNAAAFR